MLLGEDVSQEEIRKKISGKVSLVFVLVLSLAVNAILASGYLRLSGENRQLKTDPQLASREEVQAVVDEVSKLISLPVTETPTLATVTNAAALKEKQAFFANAQDGDQVLLYSQASDSGERKAYLYRPSSKQLLNVAPITIGGNTVTAQQDEFGVIIRNGTASDGLEEQMKTLMARVYPNASVLETGVASRRDYDRSVLVNINASDELATRVARMFNIEIVGLPAGESSATDADFILILGGSQPGGDSGSTDVGQTENDVGGN